MNARSPSDAGMPPDSAGRSRWTAWINLPSWRWKRSIAASPGDPGSAASSIATGRHDPRVVAALEEYLEALRMGRPGSPAEFLARHPEIADELGRCLPVLEFVEMATVPPSGSDDPSAGRCEPVVPRTQLGDYRIIREIGRGGMGVVYEAEQVSLGRRVALKVLPFAAAIDPKQRQRFQIEAQAAAQLHHPHIVPIFGVGCDQGIHYYAMQFVAGRSLAAIIHDRRRDRGAATATVDQSTPAAPDSPAEAPDSSDRTAAGPSSSPADGSAATTAAEDSGSWRDVARLGAEAAEALEHAHGLGILHRDIKPANLLIDRHGAVWIADFGLARFPGDLSLTGTGDMVGTLRYMSPEQALARRGVVDQRTDVYALGVTLYERLTLRPAFDGRDHQELLRQIALDEPAPPRRIDPAIPRDLETIVLKAMAKDPSHRYTTAQELADDLRRFLADEPILARRPGAVERAARWSRRHRELVAAVAAVVVISLAISTTLIWAQARATRIQAEKTAEAAQKAESASNAYHAYMIESFPLIDRYAEEAINRALGLAQGRAGPLHREEAFQIFDQWVRILQQTSELPRTDRASRIIIGRACTRLGYARAMLSMARGTPDGRLEPTLLARATDDYRRSIALFEDLLAASPGDATLRRYLADAAGIFGMGCCFRFANRDAEAESYYRRAIQLRRDLIRGPGPGRGAAGPHIDSAGEVSNFSRLVDTVRTLASMEEVAGRRAEAGRLIHQLQDDAAALASRFSGPDFRALRKTLAESLLRSPAPATRDGRQLLIQNGQLALILDPENSYANNDLAWALVSSPEDPWFDPKRALELAQKATELNPPNWEFWNTLGVAAYRLQDWGKAADALQRSTKLSRGTGMDCFFLAMTLWHQGKPQEARQWYDQAIAWIERTRSEDDELRRFHAEAAALLGVDGPRPQSAKAPASKAGAEPGGHAAGATGSGVYS